VSDHIAAVTASRRAFRNRIGESLERAVGAYGGEQESGGEDDLFHVLRVLERTLFDLHLHEMF
jgi:hypothetical protein